MGVSGLTPMLLQTSMFYFQEDVRQNDRLGHHSLALHEKVFLILHYYQNVMRLNQ